MEPYDVLPFTDFYNLIIHITSLFDDDISAEHINIKLK